MRCPDSAPSAFVVRALTCLCTVDLHPRCLIPHRCCSLAVLSYRYPPLVVFCPSPSDAICSCWFLFVFLLPDLGCSPGVGVEFVHALGRLIFSWPVYNCCFGPSFETALLFISGFSLCCTSSALQLSCSVVCSPLRPSPLHVTLSLFFFFF